MSGLAVAAQRRELVLSGYRQLLRLIYRLPDASQRQSGLQEAARTLRERRTCDDAEKHLAHLKELAARTAFLRVITPRRPSDAAQATGRFVLREGKLVEGAGEAPGSRVADGTISMDEAVRRNNQHFKRLYGADKPANMFF